jgi:outer membrane receptor protein involved in Fe transport
MVYGRIATGYVPGGPNDVLPGSSLPESYHSSTTTNYEVGVKSSLLDDKLSIDMDVFDVEWRDIQLIAQVGSLYGATNGGTAKSQGVEWALGYIPVDGLTLNFSGAYTDARLTEATPASVGGEAGDPLPYSALWTTTTSVGYEHPLFNDYSGFVNADWRYSGNRESEFSTFGREHLPAYSIFDLRLGIENDRWTVALYAKNLADERAFTAVTSYVYDSATVITPRTIGIELSKQF